MILTTVGLDKRAMDHVEGHAREKQLNSIVWMKLYFSHTPITNDHYKSEK